MSGLTLRSAAITLPAAEVASSPPTDVAVTAGADGQTVDVTFTAPAGDPPASYTIATVPPTGDHTGTKSPITVTGLDPATEYTFTVTATSTTGTTSEPSTAITFTTAG